MMALIATAVEISARGTRLGTRARREGWLKPMTIPFTKTRANNISIVMTSNQVRRQRAADRIIASVWVMAMTLRRLIRSATAPPMGPMKTEGNRSANATAPSQPPDSVNSQVSQPTAMRCIQVPTSETELPAT